ncbi:MAG: CrcB family protein, partial [Pseudorhodobacter sp.]|nr:CrcB family protein [Pseudorhodobacter sp.]
MIMTLFHVALGGALGASARYLTNVAVMRALGQGFPYGTLLVNVLGSFLMGVLVAV